MAAEAWLVGIFLGAQSVPIAVLGIKHLVIPAFTITRSFNLLSTTTFFPTYFVVTRGKKEEVCWRTFSTSRGDTRRAVNIAPVVLAVRRIGRGVCSLLGRYLGLLLGLVWVLVDMPEDGGWVEEDEATRWATSDYCLVWIF